MVGISEAREDPAGVPFGARGKAAVVLPEPAGNTRARLDFDALEAVSGDVVDDTDDRVRPVNRRGAVRHDVDALQSGRSDQRIVDVLATQHVDAVRHYTMAVDQDEGG